MGSMDPRRGALLLILIVSTSLFLTSSAGITRKLVNWPRGRIGVASKEMPSGFFQGREDGSVHERMLKVKTNDYGTYDPAPAFVKPPFKLIPN